MDGPPTSPAPKARSLESSEPIPRQPSPAGSSGRPPEPGWRPRVRALGGNLALLLAGCGVALLLLEVFLRVYNPFGQRLWGDRIVLPTRVHHVLDNTDDPKLDRYIYFSKNSLGFRGEEPPADPARHLTIVTVGGSTTECWYLSDGGTWPALLGRELARNFDRVWVNNAGLDGHSTFGHLLLLQQRILPLKPKLALFLVGLNDMGRDGTRHEVQMVRGIDTRSWELFVTSLARQSAVVATLQNLERGLEARRMNLWHRQVDVTTAPRRLERGEGKRAQSLLRTHRERYLPPFKERVQEIVRLCRSAGIEPVFLTQPALYGPFIDEETRVDLGTLWVKNDVSGTLGWKLLEEYNEVVREVGRQSDILVVDLAARLPKNSRYYYDLLHFSNAGAAVVSRIVYADLCPFLADRFADHVTTPCPTGSSP